MNPKAIVVCKIDALCCFTGLLTFFGISVIFAFCTNLLKIVSFGFTFKSVSKVFDHLIIVRAVILRGFFIANKIFLNIFTKLFREAIFFPKSLGDVWCWLSLVFCFVGRATTIPDDNRRLTWRLWSSKASCSSNWLWLK